MPAQLPAQITNTPGPKVSGPCIHAPLCYLAYFASRIAPRLTHMAFQQVDRTPTPTRTPPEPAPAAKSADVTPLAIPQRAISLDEIVTHEDPTPLYSDLAKIGQGASGAVFVAVDTRTKYAVRLTSPLLLCVFQSAV